MLLVPRPDSAAGDQRKPNLGRFGAVAVLKARAVERIGKGGPLKRSGLSACTGSGGRIFPPQRKKKAPLGEELWEDDRKASNHFVT